MPLSLYSGNGSGDLKQNPFQSTIDLGGDEPVRFHNLRIQGAYERHRSSRNAEFKNQILAPSFRGWQIDQILHDLTEAKDNSQEGLIDPRNNLAFVVRPPRHVRALISEIQQELHAVARTLWLMPSEQLHLTVLEIASAKSVAEIDALLLLLSQRTSLTEIVNFTQTHRARLIRPLLTFDSSGIALSFVPGAGDVADAVHDDRYTYHHLRRDLYATVARRNFPVTARYIAPSAHVTIARFITQDGFVAQEPGTGQSVVDRENVGLLVRTISEINQKLMSRYWTIEDQKRAALCEWIVGQEKGLELIKGRSWYGKGEKVLVGQGFP
ncbi:RNA ligase/cyclic nucleotide phosphodiesterase [Aspergillus bertholletiae]|uniref:RNA ligase/cyclic nucleotide phosphodiesterase n=1 Tax=Aspergillus bertholletiae TaxID=1226010 RepID=A0A5N7BPW0_9EURO|nr:RNA ligase/cyclic nucleotide phosphodiesterase [Aspergillus bertholletiae]